ncbi:MAG: hypothetical protein PHC97_00125 [Patescibacteria group bacterium]|nr:hypothetical protein [Patescibacteria group bacterium]
MKKRLVTYLALILILFPLISASAQTAATYKQDWFSAQQSRIAGEKAHNQAVLDYAANKTPENDQRVIETTKALLNSALDEAAAWLNWKNSEAKESPEVPDSIKASIQADVNTNLAKINSLRTEVNAIKNRLDAGVVFLKMVGAYAGLLADVARNTGAMWVYIGNERINTASNFETQLRAAAEKIGNNSDIISKLDLAKSEINLAKSKVDLAEAAYKKVAVPGTPLIKFAEGNNDLTQAKTNLLNAQAQLLAAFNLIIAK